MTNKTVFLLLVIYSSIRLRKAQTTHRKTNTISFLIIIPICILSNFFVTINEFLLNILSLDTGRKAGFIITLLFTMAMTCNHIMMQAQAKTKIISGARRVSTMVVKAGQIARQSIRRASGSVLTSFNPKRNKIGITSITEVSRESSTASRVQENRFSLTELTEDEYDPVMVKTDENESVKLLQNDDHERDENVENVENEEM
eukprot:UN04712